MLGVHDGRTWVEPSVYNHQGYTFVWAKVRANNLKQTLYFGAFRQKASLLHFSPLRKIYIWAAVRCPEQDYTLGPLEKSQRRSPFSPPNKRPQSIIFGQPNGPKEQPNKKLIRTAVLLNGPKVSS